MLFGVSRANANDTRLVVRNCVEIYTFDTTPRAEAENHSSAVHKAHNFSYPNSFYYFTTSSHCSCCIY
jgi:hypothetical protein